MTPEEIKKLWNASSDELPAGAPLDDYMKMKRHTSLDDLAATYRRFSIVSPIVAAIMLLNFFHPEGILSSGYPWLGMMAVMIVASLADAILYNKIRSIDLLTMTVSQVAEAAASARRFHLRMQVVLIAMAIPALWWFIASIGVKAGLWGAVAGGVVGLAIGINLWLKIMRNYRTLIRK